ncbi:MULTISPECIES: TRAP transporter small permease [Nocardiopsis]|uniref:C4-dicarboxylate ABC transporter permease n=1 Tax=Nocardiopsis sinuspersici TaxID=501010 RepID=A0A1V3C215_9ACTN|nr:MULTISPECIES: TRAP transporter small permease [Nocardiopsis]OOC54844.1 C4-dicarboxylate ABC transporter permease [Nocardiopsis sinuspersici]
MAERPPPPGNRTPRPRPAPVRWLETAELVLGVALLALVLVLMLTQATQRHLPVDGWVWTGELARLGLVWLSFSLVGYLLGRDEHITLKVVDFVLTGRALRGVWILANLVVAAVGVMCTLEAVELVFGGSPQTTPALRIPISWTYVIPLAGLALMSLRAVANAVLVPEPPQREGRVDSGEAVR